MVATDQRMVLIEYPSRMKFCISTVIIVLLFADLPAQDAGLRDVDFIVADSIASLYPGHSLRDLKALADKLTKPLITEEGKFRAIYRWVCTNIENDYDLYIRNKRRREKTQDLQTLAQWNKGFSAQVFKKLVREHKTVCSGYAYVVKELAFHAGLTCKIIDGYGRTAHANVGGRGIVNHSWNAVKLHGQWYLCDATWSSGIIDPQTQTFIKEYDNGYFLADPLLFIRNHYPLDTASMLVNDKPTLHEFLNGPLIYRGALRHGFHPCYPETFNTSTVRGEPLTFRFRIDDEVATGNIEMKIGSAPNATAVSIPLYRDANGLYCGDHIFRARGTYVVHLLIHGDHVVTYRVKVV